MLIESNFLDKIASFIFVITGYLLFRVIRRYKAPKDKCEGCIELKQRGICTGLQLEAKLMQEYSDYATILLEKDIYAKVLQKHRHTSQIDNFESLKLPE
ncbi:MAG: hypothetical protein GY870_00730 [archaeon]|nr:hypothetical protein [archaeon]